MKSQKLFPLNLAENLPSVTGPLTISCMRAYHVSFPHQNCLIFGQVFEKTLSFKIAMSGAGAHHPRLTFFQSCILPLFFSGLLSYLVGMKRRTSRSFTCKSDISHCHLLFKKKKMSILGFFLVSCKVYNVCHSTTPQI